MANHQQVEQIRFTTSENPQRKLKRPARLISSVEEQLMSEVTRAYKETSILSDELLSALRFVYDAPLLPALGLVDNRAVTRVECPSKRHLYHVIGSSGMIYTCFRNSNYCSCPAYRFSVLLKDDHILCKHVLALRLSEAMGVTKVRSVSDKEMVLVILQME